MGSVVADSGVLTAQWSAVGTAPAEVVAGTLEEQCTVCGAGRSNGTLKPFRSCGLAHSDSCDVYSVSNGEDLHPGGRGRTCASGRRGLDSATRVYSDCPQEPGTNTNQRQGKNDCHQGLGAGS